MDATFLESSSTLLVNKLSCKSKRTSGQSLEKNTWKKTQLTGGCDSLSQIQVQALSKWTNSKWTPSQSHEKKKSQLTDGCNSLRRIQVIHSFQGWTPPCKCPSSQWINSSLGEVPLQEIFQKYWNQTLPKNEMWTCSAEFGFKSPMCPHVPPCATLWS